MLALFMQVNNRVSLHNLGKWSMRRALLPASLLIALTVGLIVTVTAQDATPTPTDTSVLLATNTDRPLPTTTFLPPELVPIVTEIPTLAFPATPTTYIVPTLAPFLDGAPTFIPTIPAFGGTPYPQTNTSGELTSGFAPEFDVAAADGDNVFLIAAGDSAALAAALASVGAGEAAVIYLNADKAFDAPESERLYLNPSTLVVSAGRSVVIHGNNAILKRDPLPGRGIFVATGASLDLRHVTLRDTNVPALPPNLMGDGYGGALRIQGNLRLSDSVIENNHGGHGGGGLLNLGGNVTLRRVTFQNNFASGGGAILNEYDGAIDAECTRFIDSSTGYGGAVLNGGGYVPDEGGPIVNGGSVVRIRHSAFSGNSTLNPNSDTDPTFRGGDIFNLVASITIDARDNWWGAANVPDVDDDGAGSFSLTPILSADPTVPDVNGVYAYAPCQPVTPVGIPIELALSLDVDTSRLTADQLADPYTFTIGEQIPRSTFRAIFDPFRGRAGILALY
ncbi:MAG: hypothetical protein SGJ24_15820 [Chloroflexota bacterium]|nr:hypothetical protein [Chloroflexota bacterium]